MERLNDLPEATQLVRSRSRFKIRHSSYYNLAISKVKEGKSCEVGNCKEFSLT